MLVLNGIRYFDGIFIITIASSKPEANISIAFAAKSLYSSMIDSFSFRASSSPDALNISLNSEANPEENFLGHLSSIIPVKYACHICHVEPGKHSLIVATRPE